MSRAPERMPSQGQTGIRSRTRSPGRISHRVRSERYLNFHRRSAPHVHRSNVLSTPRLDQLHQVVVFTLSSNLERCNPVRARQPPCRSSRRRRHCGREARAPTRGNGCAGCDVVDLPEDDGCVRDDGDARAGRCRRRRRRRGGGAHERTRSPGCGSRRWCRSWWPTPTDGCRC